MKRHLLVIFSFVLMMPYQLLLADDTNSDQQVYTRKEGNITIYSDQPFIGSQRDETLSTATSENDANPTPNPGAHSASSASSETSKADASQPAAPVTYSELKITQPHEDNKSNIYNTQSSVVIKASLSPVLQRGDKIQLSMVNLKGQTLFTVLGDAQSSSINMSAVRANQATANAGEIATNVSVNNIGQSSEITITLSQLNLQNFWQGNGNEWKLAIVRDGQIVKEANPVSFTVIYEQAKIRLLKVSAAHTVVTTVVNLARNVLSPV